MNQILVNKKLYITPELKRKKKVYKFNLIASVFLVSVIISICIYIEFERNKNEEISQEILAQFNETKEEDTTIAQGNVLVVVLSEENEIDQENEEEVILEQNKHASQKATKTTKSGFNYVNVATIEIPKINVKYPVLDGETDSIEETDALLKIAPTKFWGPEPNKVGNFCVVGHNYRNTKFFSKVPTLENGDIITITDLSGKIINYRIYDKYEVVPDDLSCTSQMTEGRKEVTLITCTDDSKLRVIVKARAIL